MPLGPRLGVLILVYLGQYLKWDATVWCVLGWGGLWSSGWNSFG